MLQSSHLSCLISSLQSTYGYYHLKHNSDGDKHDPKPKGVCIKLSQALKVSVHTEIARYAQPNKSPLAFGETGQSTLLNYIILETRS